MLFVSYSGAFGGAERAADRLRARRSTASCCLACPEGAARRRARARPGCRVFALRGAPPRAARGGVADRLLAAGRLAGHARELRAAGARPRARRWWSPGGCARRSRCAARPRLPVRRSSSSTTTCSRAARSAPLVRRAAARADAGASCRRGPSPAARPRRQPGRGSASCHPGVDVDRFAATAPPAQPAGGAGARRAGRLEAPRAGARGGRARAARSDPSCGCGSSARRCAATATALLDAAARARARGPTSRARSSSPARSPTRAGARARDLPAALRRRASRSGWPCSRRSPPAARWSRPRPPDRPRSSTSRCGHPVRARRRRARRPRALVDVRRRPGAGGGDGRRGPRARARRGSSVAAARASFAGGAWRPRARVRRRAAGAAARARDRHPQLGRRARATARVGRAATCPGARVVVVDCASSDETRRGRAGPRTSGDADRARATTSASARACNRGLEHVAEPVTALVNPDVELLDDSLLALAAEARRRPRAAARAARALARRVAPGHGPPGPRHRLADLVRALSRRPLFPDTGALAPWRSRGAAAGRLGGRLRARRAHRHAAPARPVRRADLPVRRGPRPRPARRGGRASRRGSGRAARVLHHRAHSTARGVRRRAVRAAGARPPRRRRAAPRAAARPARRRRAGGHVRLADRAQARARPPGRARAPPAAGAARRGARMDAVDETAPAAARRRRDRRRGAAAGRRRVVAVGRLPARRAGTPTPRLGRRRRRLRPTPRATVPRAPAPATASSSAPTSTGCSTTAPTRRPRSTRSSPALRATGATLARSDALWEASEPSAAGRRRAPLRLDVRRLDRGRARRARPAAGCRSSTTRRRGPQSIPGQDHSPPTLGRRLRRVRRRARRALRHRRLVLARAPGAAGAAGRHVRDLERARQSGVLVTPRPDAAGYATLYARARDAIARRRPERPRDRRRPHGPRRRSCPRCSRPRPTLARPHRRVAIHPYGANPLVVLAKVARIAQVLDAAGLGSVPLYVTEFGWTTHPPGALD